MKEISLKASMVKPTANPVAKDIQRRLGLLHASDCWAETLEVESLFRSPLYAQSCIFGKRA